MTYTVDPPIAPAFPPEWATPSERYATVLGRAVDDWCKRHAMSQIKLSEHLGVDHSYISRIVNGQRLPSRDVATKLAEVMEVPLADMALMLFDIDPAAFRADIDQRTRDAVLSAVREAVDNAQPVDATPKPRHGTKFSRGFPSLIKQLDKGEIDLDTFVIEADQMGISRSTVEQVVGRTRKEAA